ncbi:hypothetical protein C5C57_05700 [Rathayibacter sp. AY1C5]|nr:hypothetical protein C5C57_05700 [Rathayibacter sp. AY1C5]
MAVGSWLPDGLRGEERRLCETRRDESRSAGDYGIGFDDQRDATSERGVVDVGAEVEVVLHVYFYCLKRGSLSLL